MERRQWLTSPFVRLYRNQVRFRHSMAERLRRRGTIDRRNNRNTTSSSTSSSPRASSHLPDTTSIMTTRRGVIRAGMAQDSRDTTSSSDTTIDHQFITQALMA